MPRMQAFFFFILDIADPNRTHLPPQSCRRRLRPGSAIERSAITTREQRLPSCR